MSLTKITNRLVGSSLKTAISGSDIAESSSFSTRTTTLESASGSFSTRTTALESDSGSFSTRTTTVEGRVNQGVKTTDSPTFAGGTVTGNLSVGGTLTAQEVHTEFESASIIFTSGSTIFGNSSDDIHNMTGSLNISGSLTLDDGNLVINDKVGIGTDNPDSYYSDYNNLVVYENGNAGIAIIGGTNGESSLGFGDGTGAATYRGAVAYVHTSGANQDKMFFKTAATNRVVIDSSGQVGIGTTVPLGKLHVEHTTDDTDEAVNIAMTVGGGATGNVRHYWGINNSSNYAYYGAVESGTQYVPLILQPNGSKVGIGTTSPDGELDVVKDGGVAQLRVKSIGSGDDGIIDVEGISNKDAQIRFYDGGGFNWRLRNKTDTNNRMELFNGSVAGVFINDGSTSWSGTSDERVKDNIVEITNATDKLKDLRCVSFNWTWDEDKTTHLGLLAQDVEKVFPEVVSGDSSKDIEETEKDGLIERTNVMGVEYTSLVPVLIKSVQELTKRIEELEK